MPVVVLTIGVCLVAACSSSGIDAPVSEEDSSQAAATTTLTAQTYCSATTSYWSRKRESGNGNTCTGTITYSRAPNTESVATTIHATISPETASGIHVSVYVPSFKTLYNSFSTGVLATRWPTVGPVATFMGSKDEGEGANPRRAVKVTLRPTDAVNSMPGVTSITVSSDSLKTYYSWDSCHYTRVVINCSAGFNYPFKANGPIAAGSDAGGDTGWEAGGDAASTQVEAEAGPVRDAASDPVGDVVAAPDGATIADAGQDAPRSEQDLRCLAGYKDVRDIDAVVSTVLGVAATCTAETERRVSYGSDYYYAGRVRCALAEESSPTLAASFSDEMKKRSYSGFAIASAGSPPVSTVTGPRSTRLCSSY